MSRSFASYSTMSVGLSAFRMLVRNKAIPSSRWAAQDGLKYACRYTWPCEELPSKIPSLEMDGNGDDPTHTHSLVTRCLSVS